MSTDPARVAAEVRAILVRGAMSHDLDIAEDRLATARAALARIEALRDEYDDKIEPLERRRDELARLVGDAVIASALGEGPIDAGDDLREALSAVNAEIAECTAARDAAERRIRPAREACNHAGQELRDTITAIAKPLAADIANRTREAFREAYRLQRLFVVVSETASPGSWESNSVLHHGDPDSADSLSVIAHNEGVREANLWPILPIAPLSLAELRHLALTRDVGHHVDPHCPADHTADVES